MFRDKDIKAVCKVGCLGCKACERTSGMFTVVDNLSTIDYNNYTLENLKTGLAAAEKCPRNRSVFVGIPSEKDIVESAKEDLPEVIMPDFKTTVDDTGWRG